jgi:osmotically-inducible protein OsmY
METQTSEKKINLATADGATEVESRILCRLAGKVRHFRLLASDKGVILRGQAHTYYARQLAQHAVMEATSLRIVANEIEVSRSGSAEQSSREDRRE